VDHDVTALYVVSPYSIGSEGKAIPDLPKVCPCRDGQSCEITIHHLRHRKTGPPFPLYVMRCNTHKRSFTLYPPGYYPYSRHTLAPVDPEGNLLSESDDIPLFAGTLFEAATDAASGIAWPSESEENSLTLRFSTQVRHLQRATILLGLDPAVESRLREETAEILQVPGQLLSDGASQILLPKCGYQGRGKAICNVLEQIPTNTLFERLAEAGAGAGLWSPPFFQDCKMLRPSLFRRVRTRGSPKEKGGHCRPQLCSVTFSQTLDRVQ